MNSPESISPRPLSSVSTWGAAPSTSGTESEFALSPALLLMAVRKHWVLMVLSLALCVAGASLYTARQTRIYEASATVQMDPQPLAPLGIQGKESGPESFWSNQEYFATQHQILTSRKIAAAVVRKLGLNRDPHFLAQAPAGKQLPPVNLPMDTAAEVLRGRLSVKPVSDSRLARIVYRDADPDRAQRVVSTVIDTYVDQNLDMTLSSATTRAEWLDTQLVKLKADLEAQEMDLHDFKKRNNLLSVSFDDQSNMLRAEIQQLNTTLTELKARREGVAARLNVLAGINPEDPALIPQSELLGNVVLAPLRAAYIEAKKELERTTALGKGENHPETQVARTNVRAARDALVTELGNIRAGVTADLDAVQRELGGVTTLYTSAKAQAMELNLNEVKYARLRRSKDNTEQVFGVVLERSTESGLSKLMPFNNVRVLDRPLRPQAPVLPRSGMNLAFGMALGLMLGLLGAVGRELLDRTVRDVEDVERTIGLPSLGSLPDVSSRSAREALYYGAYSDKKSSRRDKDKAGAAPANEDLVPELLVHVHPKSAAAEASRAVRTNLLFMSPDQPYRSLLVTSGGPAEGKTMVACSIAVAMSQAGQRVCLIDCDLRRPRVHTVFGRNLQEGVTTALLDPNRLDDAVKESTVPNLWVLPAGPMPPNPADLVHSEAFGRLLDSLKSRFDRIVVDSPPVCIVTDAVVLSTRLDATVLVLRARRTRRDAALRALRALRDVGGNVAGFVLNAVTRSSGQYSYSYYRPYGSSSAESDHEPAAAARG
jgi:capsular exopolysaccharide synthesis family protein